MILYHGTSTKHLPGIFRHGLRGRGKDGVTNWEHTIESNPDTVYLTDTYPTYFALNASDPWDTPVIIEIDTSMIDPDWGFLVPDEDALEQGTRGLSVEEKTAQALDGWMFPPDDMTDMYERTRWFRDRADQLADYWPGSLNVMGTCGFRGTIWSGAFTRLAFLTDPGPLQIVAADAQISVMNFQFCASHHRNVTRIIFGDTDDLEESLMGMDLSNMTDPHARYRELIDRCKVEVLPVEEVEQSYLEGAI